MKKISHEHALNLIYIESNSDFYYYRSILVMNRFYRQRCDACAIELFQEKLILYFT